MSRKKERDAKTILEFLGLVKSRLGRKNKSLVETKKLTPRSKETYKEMKKVCDKVLDENNFIPCLVFHQKTNSSNNQNVFGKKNKPNEEKVK